jgi:integrase/recombinase XerD
MLTIFRRHLKTCPHTSRKDRRCRCPLHVEGTLAGEPIRKALDLTTWDAAQALVREWEANGRLARPRITVAEAVEKFLADARARLLKEETVLLYQRFLRGHFVPWCNLEGHETFDRLDVDAVREYRATWKWAGTTASRRVERLRTFFNFCVESEWITRNPAKCLRPPIVRTQPTEPFTREEMTAIIAACDQLVTRGTYGTDANRARVTAFVFILRHTGLRISDAARLDTSKVKRGKVFLYTQKTGTPVWVPIPPFVSDVLAEVPRHGLYYFQTGEAAGKTVRGTWDRTLRIIFKIAGIRGGHAHRFRDTFAVELLLQGVNLQDVSILLGHSSIKVTEKHYAPWVKARQERLEAAVRSTWQPMNHDAVAVG